MKPRPILLIALALSLWVARNSSAQAQPHLSAREQLQQIRNDLKRSHAAGNAVDYLAAARKNADFLNGSPASLLQLMTAQAFAGETGAALTTFSKFVQMGQASENTLQLPMFEQLRQESRFAALTCK